MTEEGKHSSSSGSTSIINRPGLRDILKYQFPPQWIETTGKGRIERSERAEISYCMSLSNIPFLALMRGMTNRTIE